jgi:hypothetical protein
VITSGGNRNPAKLDLNAGLQRERRIDQACLTLLSTDATDPGSVPESTVEQVDMVLRVALSL